MKAADAPTALYRFYDRRGTLLYIGIAKDFRRRWNEHARSKQWWPQVCRQVIDWYPSRRRALTAEAKAIRGEHPRFNVDHNGYPARPSRPHPSAPRPSAPQSPKPLLFSTGEAAKLLRPCMVAWLEALASDGAIPCEEINGTKMWSPLQISDIRTAIRIQNPQITVRRRLSEMTPEERRKMPLEARTPARRRQADAAAATLKAKPPRRKRDAA